MSKVITWFIIIVTLIIVGVCALGAFLFFSICLSTQNYYVSKDKFAQSVSLIQSGRYKDAATGASEGAKHDRRFYYLLGWDELIMGDNNACAADIQEYLEETDVRDSRSAYAVIAASIAYQKSNRRGEALELLRWWQKYEDRLLWPTPILKFLRGEYTQDQVLKEARTPEMTMEAKTCLGASDVVATSKTDKLKLLGWVRDHYKPVTQTDLHTTFVNTNKLNTVLMHQLAIAELKRLAR
jgi:hypothetical protein